MTTATRVRAPITPSNRANKVQRDRVAALEEVQELRATFDGTQKQ